MPAALTSPPYPLALEPATDLTIVRAETIGLSMNRRKRRRLAFAAALVAASTGAAALIVYALQDNVLYFYSPSDVIAKHVEPGTAFRIGGLVETQSLHRGKGAEVNFVVTDGKSSIAVEYRGILPALFREGRGVVALGALTTSGVFAATEVLAKHDERYMPPDVVDALKRAGRWQEGPAQ
jgi:cytochrome c-type biogenesis protein CcmE